MIGLPILHQFVVVAQADVGSGVDRWLERGVAGLLALVIAWLLKTNSTDRRELKEANTAIAAGNQAAMKEVSAAIEGSADRMTNALEAIKTSIQVADARSLKSAVIIHAALETAFPPGHGRPTLRQIREAVEAADALLRR